LDTSLVSSYGYEADELQKVGFLAKTVGEDDESGIGISPSFSNSGKRATARLSA
jgi:hypothetical protein